MRRSREDTYTGVEVATWQVPLAAPVQWLCSEVEADCRQTKEADRLH